MINMIKMDLYRMFRSKSFYVIWIIMAAVLIFITSMMKIEEEYMQENNLSYEEMYGVSGEEETVNIGMSVSTPTLPGEKITLLDCLFANMQAKLIALFLVIFSVIFSTADVTSGYIKNIAGQVKNRQKLIFSKAVVLSVYTVLSVVWIIVVQGLSNLCFLGYLEIGNTRAFISYILIQMLLHIALVLVSMAIAIVVRNNLVSMILVVCLCVNLTTVVYSGIDKVLQKIGILDFSIIDYTVTGKISLLSMTPSTQECVSTIIVAVLFGAVLTVAAGGIFKHRDI